MHGTGSAVSSTHSKRLTGRSALNVKVTLVLSVWASTPMSGTTESIVVFGGGVTVQV